MYAGIIVIIGVVYLLIKRKDTRTVLFGAGLLMALLSGKPMLALDAFATRMTAGSLIMPICSVMGFATVLKLTKCDQHLVNLVVGALSKIRPLLIPGAAAATWFINIALPSAAGTSAAVGAIFIPILVQAGIHPATAATAIMLGTFGSSLSPGSSHNAMISEMAGNEVMDIVAAKTPAALIGLAIGIICLVIVAKILKEDKGYVLEANSEAKEIEKANFFYAMICLIPIVILVLGSTVVPLLKMGVPQAMLIGTLLAILVTRTNPKDVTKSFFDGMGKAYADVMGIIICAAVFVAGMDALGLVEALTNALMQAPTSAVRVATSMGTFVLAVITGSGDAATLAFNEALTPQAEQFGMTIANMGNLVHMGGALGRTMSPLAGGAIICAGLAKVEPMEILKRNAPGMIVALIGTILILA